MRSLHQEWKLEEGSFNSDRAFLGSVRVKLSKLRQSCLDLDLEMFLQQNNHLSNATLKATRKGSTQKMEGKLEQIQLNIWTNTFKNLNK